MNLCNHWGPWCLKVFWEISCKEWVAELSVEDSLKSEKWDSCISLPFLHSEVKKMGSSRIWRLGTGCIPMCEHRTSHPQLVLTYSNQVYSLEGEKKMLFFLNVWFQKEGIRKQIFFSSTWTFYSVFLSSVVLFFCCGKGRSLPYMQPFFHIFLRPLSYMNYNARSGVGNWQSRTIQCTILGVQKRKEASRTDLHSQPLSDLLFFYDT